MLYNDIQTYWNNKLSAYLHDPIDKALHIPGHEERGAKLQEAFGVQKPNEEYWKKADAIAAGFERGQVPSYAKEEDKSGAINFLEHPILTHPISAVTQNQSNAIKIVLPDSLKKAPDKKGAIQKVNEELLEYIKKAIGTTAGTEGYSNNELFRKHTKTNEAADKFSQARFLYLHNVLRFKLAEDNVAGLGALWHRLPADTRFPDHSIWQHNALTSALYSSAEIGGGMENVGLMVFSITPVQAFIAKARKLRDYWTGSILLSWLAFEGITWVVENLGPDHIVYPSLIDQPLMNNYLKMRWGIDENECRSINRSTDIASFPNKFVAVIPVNKLKEIEEAIKTRIQKKWMEIADITSDFIISHSDKNVTDPENIKDIFTRQNKNYWEINITASKLVAEGNKSLLGDLFEESVYKYNEEVTQAFHNMIKGKNISPSNEGVFYEVSHRIAQSVLASRKMQKQVTREVEPGEKCPQCGEFEVLHSKAHKAENSAKDYSNTIKEYWDHLRKQPLFEADISANERLCSICTIKRIIHKAIKETKSKEHILFKTFKDADTYPSTAELSLSRYFIRNKISDDNQKKKVSQKLFDAADENTKLQGHSLKDSDKYYAILLMDGDKMGKLVNGETIAAKWESVMHPEIVNRLKQSSFTKEYRENWKDLFPKRRLLTPAVHAAISESLGDFSLYGVKEIISRNNGRLIYAGGDDVCAVLPLETALQAAEDVQKYYKSLFHLIEMNVENTNGDADSGKIQYSSSIIDKEIQLSPGKLSINLGVGENISISAGILICHYKESLKDMIQQAHSLLDNKAKKEGGRDACAIELRKRSGGSRYFIQKFTDKKVWDSLKFITSIISKYRNNRDDIAKALTTSFIYKLRDFKDGFNALLNAKDSGDKVKKLLRFQLERSVPDIKKNVQNEDELIESLHNVVISHKGEFEPTRLVVAAYMGKGGQ